MAKRAEAEDPVVEPGRAYLLAIARAAAEMFLAEYNGDLDELKTWDVDIDDLLNEAVDSVPVPE